MPFDIYLDCGFIHSCRHNIELKYIWIETGYDTNTVWNLNSVL